MKMLRVNKNEAQSVFEGLRSDYKIVAPVEKIGKGIFSDTNLVTYDQVNSFEEIEFFKNPYYSAKSFLFPIREAMFKFYNNRMEETKEQIQPMIIFLRACDINVISIMDAHFLKDSGQEDIYYKRRREKMKFFLMECIEPFQNCFCVSMGANKTDDYSVFVRKKDNAYEISAEDEELEKYFIPGQPCEVKPKFVEQDLAPISLPENIDVSLFENEIWQEYSVRCIACGRCNVTCPTCACFSVQDILCEDKSGGERTRFWSSCHVKKFALLAGNHDFRIKEADRLRYRVLHKIYDFRKRYGINMCVGCGRCDDVCPEYISMFKCIEKINHITEAHSISG